MGPCPAAVGLNRYSRSVESDAPAEDDNASLSDSRCKGIVSVSRRRREKGIVSPLTLVCSRSVPMLGSIDTNSVSKVAPVAVSTRAGCDAPSPTIAIGFDGKGDFGHDHRSGINMMEK